MEAPRASLLFLAALRPGSDLVILHATVITPYSLWRDIRELQRDESSPEMAEITYRVFGAIIEVWLTTTTVGLRTHLLPPAQSQIG